jgi:hypothetical protein
MNPSSLKALFRRATAAKFIHKFDECLADMDQMLSMSLTPDLQKQVLILRSEAKELSKADKSVRSKEEMPSSFVSMQQTIKLFFNQSHTSTMVLNSTYTYRLSLCNEFGLFFRDLMPRRPDSLFLSATVISTCTHNLTVDFAENKFNENGKVSYEIIIDHLFTYL